MANGGIRRFVAAAGAMLAAGLSAGLAGKPVAARPVDNGNRRNSHHADREDVYLGRWSYARKGKRTAARVKRAARKKRNRARHK